MIEIKTIETKDLVMEYFEFGHGEKTLVILPGVSVKSVMESAELIATDYAILTENFTIYVFDRRTNLPKNYSFKQMADDALAAIHELGLKNIYLFGTSQGGMIALDIAIRELELVSKLVLGSTSAKITEEQRKLFETWAEKAREKNAEELLLTFGKDIYPEEIFEKSRELIIDLAKTVTDDEMERFIKLLETMKEFDVSSELKNISCPVLYIGDKTDCIFGEDAAELMIEGLKDAPDFQSYMYDGYGHSPYDFAPDYKERLLNFLL